MTYIKLWLAKENSEDNRAF